MIREAAGGLQGNTHQFLVPAGSLKDPFPQLVIETAFRRSEPCRSFGSVLNELGLLPSLLLVTFQRFHGEIIHFKASLDGVGKSHCILQRQVRALSPGRVKGMSSISK